MDPDLENRLTSIEAQLAAIQTWLVRLEQREINEEISFSAEVMRGQAEEGRQHAEQERVVEEELRVDKEGVRFSAEKRRMEQEDARVIAEQARHDTQVLRQRLDEQEALLKEMRQTLTRLESQAGEPGPQSL